MTDPLAFSHKESSKWNGLLSKESLFRKASVKGEEHGPEPEAEVKDEVAPVTFWAPSLNFCRELLIRHDVASCLDLTAMDSQLALACLERGIPYTGIAQTGLHARQLEHRIKSKFLQMMLDPASEHFSSALAAVNAAHSGVALPDLGAEEVTPKKKKGGVRAPGARSSTKKIIKPATPSSQPQSQLC